MPTLTGSFWRDANRVPLTVDGLTVTKSTTLTGSNATVVTPIFTVTGVVEIRAMYGVVTTALGTAHTVAAYRLNDQTAQVDITAVGGTTLSSFAAGSMFLKRGLAATAVVAVNNSAGRANDPTAASLQLFSPIILTKKTGALTQIEYVYATTETPTSGVIQHFIRYIPLSIDGALTAT